MTKNKVRIIIPIILTASAIIFLQMNLSPPKLDTPFELYHFLGTSGILLIMLYWIYSVFRYRGTNYNHYQYLLMSVLRYSIVMFLLGNIGDDAYMWLVTHPRASIEAFCIAVLIYFILKDGTQGMQGNSGGIAYAHQGEMVAKVATPKDLQHIAAHEAGHMLVYAALDKLPSDTEIVILHKGSRNGTLGFTTGIKDDHCLTDMSRLEWQMLVLLAGSLSESFLLNERTTGSSEDNRRWMSIATLYLMNSTDEVFHAEPSNEYECSHNNDIINSLREHQTTLVRELFTMNRSVLSSMASEVLIKKKMNADEIQEFLSMVELPDEFPLVKMS